MRGDRFVYELFFFELKQVSARPASSPPRCSSRHPQRPAAPARLEDLEQLLDATRLLAARAASTFHARDVKLRAVRRGHGVRAVAFREMTRQASFRKLSDVVGREAIAAVAAAVETADNDEVTIFFAAC